jgi:ABC-type multidrug transport system fused ATPase/permease subunit
MTSATRIILMLPLLLALTRGLAGQETTTDAAATATETTSTAATTSTTEGGETTEGTATPGEATRPTSYETRNQFTRLLQEYPSEVATVLVHDPNLLTNQTYLDGHPELARFIQQHPEVSRNPRFYLSEFSRRRDRNTALEQLLEGMFVVAVFLFLAFALAWLIRTVVEQKRWNRLSRTQSEVHNKILDRFGSTTELLEYIRTPAGTKFLESAPIPLHVERTRSNPPFQRVIWSIQIGVVIAAGAIGMMVVSGRFDQETNQGLFAMGVIGFCVGVGFIASALISLVLTRRLGAWQAESSASALAERIIDPEHMR